MLDFPNQGADIIKSPKQGVSVELRERLMPSNFLKKKSIINLSNTKLY